MILTLKILDPVPEKPGSSKCPRIKLVVAKRTSLDALLVLIYQVLIHQNP